MILIAEEARGEGETRESDYGSDEACLLSSQRMCVKRSECVFVCARVDLCIWQAVTLGLGESYDRPPLTGTEIKSSSHHNYI